VYNGLKPIKETTTSPKEGKNVLPIARTHKKYQEFVEKELRDRGLSIPAFFTDVYKKLINLDLSKVNTILKFRYSKRGAPARASDNMFRSLLAI